MPPISALPAAPDPNDRSTFNARAYPWSVALNGMTSEINAVLPAIDSASAASAAAIAAANYKGLWSSLSGALAIPATVFHNNARWLLLENLANVATEEPGVSAKWASLSGTVELITSTSAVAVATVDFTNFDTLAATYMSLRLVACGLVGSAASADLNGQIRISNTWQSVSAWQSIHVGGGQPVSSLGPTSGLKNTAGRALTTDITVNALGLLQQPAVTFTTMGGSDSVGGFSYAQFGGSYFDTGDVPTTAIQGLRIAASTGNISGTFRLYGVRK